MIYFSRNNELEPKMVSLPHIKLKVSFLFFFVIIFLFFVFIRVQNLKINCVTICLATVYWDKARNRKHKIGFYCSCNFFLISNMIIGPKQVQTLVQKPFVQTEVRKLWPQILTILRQILPSRLNWNDTISLRRDNSKIKDAIIHFFGILTKIIFFKTQLFDNFSLHYHIITKISSAFSSDINT